MPLRLVASYRHAQQLLSSQDKCGPRKVRGADDDGFVPFVRSDQQSCERK